MHESGGRALNAYISPILPIIISSLALLVTVANAVWNARTAWVWKREERDSKRPYVVVQSLEWEETSPGAGKLRATVKNAGTRPANQIEVAVRMVDYIMQSSPAPPFDFSAVNDLPSGMEYTQAIEWRPGTSLSVARVQVVVAAFDPLTQKPCPPLIFYYVWGDPSPEYDKLPPNQPFRPATKNERDELHAFLQNKEVSGPIISNGERHHLLQG